MEPWGRQKRPLLSYYLHFGQSTFEADEIVKNYKGLTCLRNKEWARAGMYDQEARSAIKWTCSQKSNPTELCQAE